MNDLLVEDKVVFPIGFKNISDYVGNKFIKGFVKSIDEDFIEIESEDFIRGHKLITTFQKIDLDLIKSWRIKN